MLLFLLYGYIVIIIVHHKNTIKTSKYHAIAHIYDITQQEAGCLYCLKYTLDSLLWLWITHGIVNVHGELKYY